MMEQYPENNAEQGYRSAATPAASPGRTLREARERLGLSVAEVANQIKFATRQIDALEADNFQQLQGATFLRGFVRSYAKILHLDAQPLLELLPLDKPVTQQMAPASVEVPFPAVLSARRQNLIWLGAALLLAMAVVGFGLWQSSPPSSLYEMTAGKSPEKSREEPIETPISLPTELKIASDLPVPEESVVSSVPVIPKVESAPATATVQSSVPAKKIPATKIPASQAAPQIQSPKSASLPDKSKTGAAPQTSSLRLVFGEESWTEIRDRDGKIISSQVNQPGSELRLKGHPPFAMLIGHALSVHLYQDDEEVDLKPYINKYSEVAHVTLE